MPCRAKAAVYLAMSRPWPTLAAACWVARSRGRRGRPSGARPDAIAPEDTRTTWPPSCLRAASAAASAPILISSISPSEVVSDEEPTLTTTRGAAAMSARSEAAVSGTVTGSAAQPGVGAARAGVLPVPTVAGTAASSTVPAGSAGAARAAGHRGSGVPVEHHGVVRVADQDLGTRFGARFGEGLLHAQTSQPI